MNIRTCAATAILVAASVAAGTSTVSAAPDSASSAVNYRAELIGPSVVTTLDNGAFEVAADQRSVAVRDRSGQEIDSLPLTFTIDGQQLPLLRVISADGHTLTLTPDTTALDRNALKPVASPVEDQLAMNDMLNTISLGTSVGSLIGTALGAVTGIGVGVVLAGASCLVLSLACVVTVLPTVTLVGAIGGLAGLILAGGPTAVVAAYNYFTTLNAAPGTSRFAQHLPGATR